MTQTADAIPGMAECKRPGCGNVLPAGADGVGRGRVDIADAARRRAEAAAVTAQAGRPKHREKPGHSPKPRRSLTSIRNNSASWRTIRQLEQRIRPGREAPIQLLAALFALGAYIVSPETAQRRRDGAMTAAGPPFCRSHGRSQLDHRVLVTTSWSFPASEEFARRVCVL